MSKKNLYLLSAIVIVALTRLLPHPPNFAPMGAIALFSAFAFSSNLLKYSWPVILAIATDVLLVLTVNSEYSSLQGHFSSLGTYIIYTTYLVIGLVGSQFSSKIEKTKTPTILGLSIGSGLFFFVVSNFVVWAGGAYGYSLQGLITCYVAALPFLGNTLGGELFYNAMLFGGYFYISARVKDSITA